MSSVAYNSPKVKGKKGKGTKWQPANRSPNDEDDCVGSVDYVLHENRTSRTGRSIKAPKQVRGAPYDGSKVLSRRRGCAPAVVCRICQKEINSKAYSYEKGVFRYCSMGCKDSEKATEASSARTAAAAIDGRAMDRVKPQIKTQIESKSTWKDVNVARSPAGKRIMRSNVESEESSRKRRNLSSTQRNPRVGDSIEVWWSKVSQLTVTLTGTLTITQSSNPNRNPNCNSRLESDQGPLCYAAKQENGSVAR